MTRIAFCTALYEAGRCYLPAFMTGVRAAARGHDARLVAAIDGLQRPREALAELEADLPIHFAPCAAGDSVASVRRAMLQEGVRSGAEVLVFIDIDDMLLANAPATHLAALENADFSYGDLGLMDSAGNDLRRRFFDRANVPWTVAAPDSVLRRNFLGLSNTAIRANRLPTAALQVPADILAVDWWLYTTLLAAGRSGARTTAPVAYYRLHDDNLLGAGAPATPDALRRCYTVMRRHYRAFRAAPDTARCLDRVEERLAQLALLPPGLIATRLAARRDLSGVWYEGLDGIDFATDAVAAASG